MAHNLNYNELKKQYSFATANELAWHKLGQLVPNRMTTYEALLYGHLDYMVERTPLYAEIDGVYKDIKNSYVTYRTDTNTILCKNGKSLTKQYEIIQNRDAFIFFDSIIDKNEAIIETVGALGDGELIFITAKLPETYITPNDVVDNYLFLTKGHDGSMSVKIAFTPVRIVCNNTLSAALQKNTHSLTIRHGASAKERLQVAHQVMGISKKNIELTTDVYTLMTKKHISDFTKKEYFKKVFLNAEELMRLNDNNFKLSVRKENILNEVNDYSFNGIGQDMKSTRGTVWGAYNTITGYYQNVKKFGNEEKKFNSLLNGYYGHVINVGLTEAVKML